MKLFVALTLAVMLAIGFALPLMGADEKASAQQPAPAASTPTAPLPAAAPAAFSWDAVTAISTAVVAGLTLGIAIFNWRLVRETRLAVESQLREQRLSHSVDLMLKMSERWESAKSLQARKQLAASLARGRARTEFDDAAKRVLLDSSQQIMSFFETLGIMVNRAGVNPEMVWGEFAYYVIHYFLPLSRTSRRSEPTGRIRPFTAVLSICAKICWPSTPRPILCPSTMHARTATT
jgi:hypothetical protein